MLMAHPLHVSIANLQAYNDNIYIYFNAEVKPTLYGYPYKLDGQSSHAILAQISRVKVLINFIDF